GELEDQGLGGAGQPCQGGRDHKGHQLEVVDVIAQRQRPRFILPDGLQHLAKGGMDGAVNDAKADQEDGKHQVVHGEFVVQVNEAEQLTPRNPLQAVLAAGKGQLEGQKVDDLCQREGDHGEVDALATDSEVT